MINTKFIVVTGSVISGIGKGITSSSIGLLLQSRGLTVTSIKIDPYLNIDSGTLAPSQHGEAYVLVDGGETDLDLGNYERFLDIDLTTDNSITTGKVYNNVLQKERRGEYLGKTVQVIPHITDEIKRLIMKVADTPISGNPVDVVIIELGGSVGDIEIMPFIESLRLFANTRKSDFCFVHLSMIICPDSDKENQKNYKTKPTQHSFIKLREQGINPDVLVMRTPRILNDELKEKLSIHCGINSDNIISNIDVPNIYFVPQVFEDQNIFDKINNVLGFKNYSAPKLDQYNKIIEYYNIVNNKQIFTNSQKLIIVGKYTGSQDTYLSIIRAVEHAVFEVNQNNIKEKINIDIEVVDAEKFNKNTNFEFLKNVGAVIIAGGFAARGIGGKMKVVQFCRENNIPILGICLGMQIMVTEFARNVCMINAVSDEWTNESADNLTMNMGLCSDQGVESVVCILPDQNGVMGGTMRLGNHTTVIEQGSAVHKIYQQDQVVERHRHRYEINNNYIESIQSNGLKFVGKGQLQNKNNNSSCLMEITELDNHPFYIGCQFHPEFKSRYNKPHPLFVGLIRTMINHK